MLLDLFGSAEEVARLAKEELETVLKRGLTRVKWQPHKTLAEAETDARVLDREQVSCAVYGAPGYPKPLAEIPDPPFLLFYRGMGLEVGTHPVAVVGTRCPTAVAEEATFALAAELAASGCLVVSGLAFGIDRQAHRGALSRGRTWAVVAGGPDSVSPVGHRRLALEILDKGGTLVSEHPPRTPALAHHFPLRNRLISGLCRSVVVVQAPIKSGALITARYALEHNRDVYVHEAGFHPERGLGGRDLAEQGAAVIRDARPILEQGVTPWISL